VFLHAVNEGPASQSYGIQVAALAGVPAPVIKMARQYLSKLEKETVGRHPQQDLFSDAPGNFETGENRESVPQHPVFALLRTINPDELSPKQALDTLYDLKNTAEKDSP
jgi:DNA mismatch repair protein MutS